MGYLSYTLYYNAQILKNKYVLDLGINITCNGTVPAPVPVSSSACLQALSSACWSPCCTASHPESLNSWMWTSDLRVRQRKEIIKKETAKQFTMSESDTSKLLVTTCAFTRAIWPLLTPHSIIPTASHMDECMNDLKTHHEVHLVNSSGAFDRTIFFRQKRDAKYQQM